MVARRLSFVNSGLADASYNVRGGPGLAPLRRVKSERVLLPIAGAASILLHAALIFAFVHGIPPVAGARVENVPISLAAAEDVAASKPVGHAPQKPPAPTPQPQPQPQTLPPPEEPPPQAPPVVEDTAPPVASLEAPPNEDTVQEPPAATPEEASTAVVSESGGGDVAPVPSAASAPAQVTPRPLTFFPFYKVDVKPSLQYSAPIEYPAIERRLKHEGRVILEADIDETGALVAVRIQRSAGPAFDEAALSWVRASRFTPAQVQGKPVAVRMVIPVEFTLQD